MKKKMQKTLALLLGLVLAMSLLAGCGSDGNGSSSSGNNTPNTTTNENNPSSDDGNDGGQTSAIDLSEHVDLTIYLVGDTPEIYDQIVARLNEIVEPILNCSVNVEWISWSEQGTKYSLMFTGGEDFDLIFTASSWCEYEQTAAKGGFLELTDDLLNTYAPDIMATLPEVAWNQARLDGSIYMVPANYVEVNPTALSIRGDLMEKYGYSDITTWDQYLSFLKDCANDGMYGAASGSQELLYAWQSAYSVSGLSGTPSGGELITYDCMNPSDTSLTYLLDREDFREFCVQMKELADVGCWPADILGQTQERQEALLTGRAASMSWNTGSNQNFCNQANAEHPEWRCNIFNLQPEGTYSATKYVNGGIGIYAGSRNPERALMLLNLMATSQEIMDLTALGIEGKNYELREDGSYTPLEEYIPSNWWGWRNNDLIRTRYDETATEVDLKYNELNEYYLDNIRAEHVLDGFTFVTDPVQSQVSAVETAMTTYYYPLLHGFVDDVDTAIAEFRAALDTAGMQDIIAEAERQVNEFVASQQ